jgi:ATP-dependent exoDNAse (exonuclease V) alpha subunit
VHLQYPPAVVLFCPDRTPVKNLEGLPDGTIPIELSKKGMEICYPNGRKSTVHRKQLPITAAYAFTNYKAQGQTLQPVIVDIGNPPSGRLNAFNTYVVISRGRSHEMLRLLRNFNSSILQNTLMSTSLSVTKDWKLLTRRQNGGT